MRAAFVEPPNPYRPAPFWSWNDDLDETRLLEQIDAMHAAGCGGFFMHSREGLCTEYLGPEWIRLVRLCIERAAGLGMQAWLYDEDKWPSGFAGGSVPRQNPEWRHRFLVLAHEIPYAPDTREFARFEREGKTWIVVEVPGADGMEWFNGTSYTDLANSEVTRAFLDSTHEVYARACGEHFGATVPGIFTDEPGFAHLFTGPEGALPWSRGLEARFFGEKEYRLHERAEALFFKVPGYRRVRFDFFDVLTRQFVEGFSRQYHEWCREHGLILTGHFMREDRLADQTSWIGAAMPHYEYMDWPGVDHLGRCTSLRTTQMQVASAASQLGKDRVLCETFGASGQNLSLMHIKWIVNFHAALGITFINPHLLAYSLRGARKRDYPPTLSPHQPWWPHFRKVTDYTARLCTILSQGTRHCEVLVLHPISSAWAEFKPGTASNPVIEEINDALDTLLEAFANRHIDCELGDETILAEHGRIVDGRFRVGLQDYRVVVVPRGHVWKRSTLSLLRAWMETGGCVFAIGDDQWLKEGEHDFEAATLRSRATSFDPSQEQDWRTLARLIDRPVRLIDEKSGEEARFGLLHLRKAEFGDVLFLANDSEKSSRHAILEWETAGHVSFWDPETGELKSPGVEMAKGTVRIALDLPAAGSVLLVSSSQKQDTPTCTLATETSSGIQTIDGPWKVERRDPNALIVDGCEILGESMWVYDALEFARKRVGIGSPLRVTYRFVAESSLPLDLVCELPEDFQLAVNGKPIDPAERIRGSWIDPAFQRFDLSGLTRPGENTVVLEGVLQEFTEIEPVFVIGDFGVFTGDRTHYRIGTERREVQGEDLTREGYPFFAGRIVLEKAFDWNEAETAEGVLMSFDHLDAIAVCLHLNGAALEPLLWPPYRRNVSKWLRAGSNTLRIELSTSLHNLLGPHHGGHELPWVGPWMWSGEDESYVTVPVGFRGLRLIQSK